MVHQEGRGGHQPEQLLEELQVVGPLLDESVGVEDEEGAPLHAEVEADDAEVHGGELGEVVHHAQELPHTSLTNWIH